MKWISVKNCLPEPCVNVLCYFPIRDKNSKDCYPEMINIGELRADKKAFMFYRDEDAMPTHWMPLPSPPSQIPDKK